MMQELFKFFGASCQGGSFFGLPTWYKYLDSEPTSGSVIDPRLPASGCSPVINGVSDIWLIAAAVLEILLRIAVFIAIGFVVAGGIKYIVSQGEPDRLNSARSTIINALIGLVVAIAATAIISFIARQFV